MSSLGNSSNRKALLRDKHRPRPHPHARDLRHTWGRKLFKHDRKRTHLPSGWSYMRSLTGWLSVRRPFRNRAPMMERGSPLCPLGCLSWSSLRSLFIKVSHHRVGVSQRASVRSPAWYSLANSPQLDSCHGPDHAGPGAIRICKLVTVTRAHSSLLRGIVPVLKIRNCLL